MLRFNPMNFALEVKKSYAAVVRNEEARDSSLQVDVNQLACPSKKGNEVVITINEEVYQSSICDCKSNILGKTFLTRSSSRVKGEEIWKQAADLWNPGNGWRMVSLGKGLYILLRLRRCSAFNLGVLGIFLVVCLGLCLGRRISIRMRLKRRILKYGSKLLTSVKNIGIRF